MASRRPFDGHVFFTVEIELPPIERREERIGEEHMAIAADHDVVGRVEAFAFESVGENLDLAFAIGSGYAPRFVLAGVEASLAVHGIAVGAVRILAVDLGCLAGNQLVQPVLTIVAEDQEALARPDRSFAAGETGGYLLHLQLGKILCGQDESGEQKHGRRTQKSASSHGIRWHMAVRPARPLARGCCPRTARRVLRTRPAWPATA